jgi:hypothetical protein
MDPKCKYEWTDKTVAKTDNYARLQIEIRGVFYPVVPIDANEGAVCIGLPSGLCPWLVEVWMCTDPEDLSIERSFDRPMVRMCFLWVAVCACDAIQEATPEVSLWRSTSSLVTNHCWPSARELKTNEIPRSFDMPGKITIDLSGEPLVEPEYLTVQELDSFLLGGIKAGPWRFYNDVEIIGMRFPPETDPNAPRRKMIDDWQKSAVENGSKSQPKAKQEDFRSRT